MKVAENELILLENNNEKEKRVSIGEDNITITSGSMNSIAKPKPNPKPNQLRYYNDIKNTTNNFLLFQIIVISIILFVW